MSKKSFIDTVQVKTPCTEKWDEMTGTNKIRLCSHCVKDVNDLSAMTRKEAMSLVRASGGNLCVRFVQDPKTRRPLFAPALLQITRRTPGLAAGVMTASMALSTQAYAQSAPPNAEPVAPVTIEKQLDVKTPDITSNGTVSGSVIDPQGAAVPHAIVILTNEVSKSALVVSSGEDGRYAFEKVPDGTYRITVRALGFELKEIEGITVSDGSTVERLVVDLPINGRQFVTMGIMTSTVTIEYKNPITAAVQSNDIDEVRDLIARGKNVNTKEEDGTSPLAAAVETGNVEIVQMLAQFGAKINARDKQKQTPIMRLDEDATPELVRTLIRAGAKLNVVDNEGDTPLILAARQVLPEVLRIMIDTGATVNVTNKLGETPLMMAADADDLEKVRMLILAGADVNAKDKEGETAWDKTSDSDIEDLLISHGAIVEDSDDGDEIVTITPAILY